MTVKLLAFLVVVVQVVTVFGCNVLVVTVLSCDVFMVVAVLFCNFNTCITMYYFVYISYGNDLHFVVCCLQISRF